MGINPRRSLFILLCLLSASMASGQRADNYSFEILPDGSPLYSQIIKWDSDPNVLFYEVVIQDKSGTEISITPCEDSELILHLPPGEYAYRIRIYNLLGNLELELPFRNLSVLRAELPQISSLSQGSWYMEDLDTEITLTGQDLMPGAEVILRSELFPSHFIAGKVAGNRGNKNVTVEFPDKEIKVQSYTLEWTNPGGLSCTLPHAVKVSYLKPVDVLISVGFAPWFGLYDSWFKNNWPQFCYPLSGKTRISTYFLKKSYGYSGLELAFGGMRATGGISTAAINTLFLDAGLNGVYKYPINRDLFIGARLGGGVSRYYSQFDYEGTSGAEMTSYDPYIGTGFFVQYFWTNKLFLESGADWRHVFRNSFTEGGVAPFVSAGLWL